MKRIIAMLLAIVLAVALSPCGKTAALAASSESTEEVPRTDPMFDEVTLKFSHINAVDQAIGVACDKFAKLVNERSGGKVTIEVYPAGSLYNQEDAYDAIELGYLDMAVADVSGISDRVPAFGIYVLPFLFDSYDTMEKVVDGDIGAALDKQLEEQMGAVALGWCWNGSRNFLSKEPIASIPDCENILLRSGAVDIFLDTFETLKFKTVIIPWGDCFTGFQSGVCDAVETTIEALYTQGFYTIGNKLCLSRHIFSTIGPIVSHNTWNKLNDDTQQLLHDCWAECREVMNETVINAEDGYIEKLKEAGCEVTKFDDPQALIELFTPMWYKYAEKGEYTDILDMVLALK